MPLYEKKSLGVENTLFSCFDYGRCAKCAMKIVEYKVKNVLFLREAAKKVFFFIGPSTMALPPPFELNGHKFISDFFIASKKVFFS